MPLSPDGLGFSDRCPKPSRRPALRPESSGVESTPDALLEAGDVALGGLLTELLTVLLTVLVTVLLSVLVTVLLTVPLPWLTRLVAVAVAVQGVLVSIRTCAGAVGGVLVTAAGLSLLSLLLLMLSLLLLSQEGLLPPMLGLSIPPIAVLLPRASPAASLLPRVLLLPFLPAIGLP